VKKNCNDSGLVALEIKHLFDPNLLSNPAPELISIFRGECTHPPIKNEIDISKIETDVCSPPQDNTIDLTDLELYEKARALFWLNS